MMRSPALPSRHPDHHLPLGLQIVTIAGLSVLAWVLVIGLVVGIVRGIIWLW